MGEKKFTTVSDAIDMDEKQGVDLDHALAVAGLGLYNIKYSIVISLFLIGAIVEPIGNSFILPSSKCDLEMSDSIRGFIGSIPYIGIVLTSFPWGYIVDTRGRKWPLVCSSLAAGTFGIMSAFMPNMISFIIIKFLVSLCLACPAAAPYTYIGEISPLKHRDLMLTVVNALQMGGSTLVPLFAWGILPLTFETDFGAYYFKPWRLLAIVNASIFILGGLLLLMGPESPKFLVSQGRYDESLKVLRNMYAGNTGKSPDDYPIKKLISADSGRDTKDSFMNSLKVQSVPLLIPPYLKWMALNSTLMFGMFATLNGLNMWLPDILNRVLSGTTEGTACSVITSGRNESAAHYTECNDKIDSTTYLVNTVANCAATTVAVVVSATIKFTGKKLILVLAYIIIGTCCIVINFVAQQVVFATLLSSIALLAVAVGPINAYAVQIFPTHLRGMAVGLSMMMGRAGSIVGSNVAGALLNSECEATFYLFGGSLIFCGLLCFFMPDSKFKDTKPNKRRASTKL